MRRDGWRSAGTASGARLHVRYRNPRSVAVDAGLARGVLFIGRTAKGVLRSTDNGLNWQEITPPAHANGDSHAKGVHGTVHIDAVTDRVYYVTSNAAASCGTMKGGAVVSWSDDLGKSWAGSTTGCGTYDWGRMITGHHPKGLNQRAVYFFGVAPRLVGGIRPVFRSLDGGATWAKMKNPASVTTEAGAGVAAPDGTLYFDYPEFIGFDPYRVVDKTYPFKPANLCKQMIAVSEDFGETWRQEAIPNSLACNIQTGHQKVAVDKAGTVYALWTDDRDNQIYLVTSRDKARSWSKPVKVMPKGATFNNGHANIIAGEPGHIVIASLNTSAKDEPAPLDRFGLWRVECLSGGIVRRQQCQSAIPQRQSRSARRRNAGRRRITVRSGGLYGHVRRRCRLDRLFPPWRAAGQRIALCSGTDRGVISSGFQ